MTASPCGLACRERLAHLRGACPRCQTRHNNAVARGQATWAAPEAVGQALAARRPGRHFPPEEGR
jgi:hypothetical protein